METQKFGNINIKLGELWETSIIIYNRLKSSIIIMKYLKRWCFMKATVLLRHEIKAVDDYYIKMKYER